MWQALPKLSTYNNQNHLFSLIVFVGREWLVSLASSGLDITWATIRCQLRLQSSEGFTGLVAVLPKHLAPTAVRLVLASWQNLSPSHRAAWASSLPVGWLPLAQEFQQVEGEAPCLLSPVSKKSEPVPLWPFYYFGYSLDSMCGTTQGHNYQEVRTTGDRLRGWLLQMSLHILAC